MNISTLPFKAEMKPRLAIFPLLRHIMALNYGKFSFTNPVASRACDQLLEVTYIWGREGNIIINTHVYNETSNL